MPKKSSVTSTYPNRPFTPCQGCCTTALGDGVCQNCRRTAEEVDNWNFMSQEERDRVWERLEHDR
jgi:uncharacterized protein